MPKPKVITKCVANAYTGPDERVVEFSNGARSVDAVKGGLIKFWTHPETGELHVNLYRMDKGVNVHVSEDRE